MKKRRFVIIGMLMALAILAGILAGSWLIGREDYKKLSRPDRIELDIPMTAWERQSIFTMRRQETGERKIWWSMPITTVSFRIHWNLRR